MNCEAAAYGGLRIAAVLLLLACGSGEASGNRPEDSEDPSTEGAVDAGPDGSYPGDHTTGDGTKRDAGGGKPDGGSSDAGDGDGVDAGRGDLEPPTVVSISPADQASQVMDQPVVIAFSEPMNQASVQEAFPGATNVRWNDAGTTITFTIAFPFSGQPSVYVITVPTSVEDLAGNALERAQTSTVVLAALSSVTIDHTAAQTGNQIRGRSAGTFLMSGDAADDLLRYGGLTFSLSALPPRDTILAIRKAVVRTQVISIGNDPNSPGLTGFVVDHVTFTGRNIADASVQQAGFATLFTPGSIQVGARVGLPVAAQLDRSWTDAAETLQLRIYPAASNDNQTEDSVYLRRAGMENGGIVDDSLTEPDPPNRLRLEIEYFD
jgi:hypothetical protein